MITQSEARVIIDKINSDFRGKAYDFHKGACVYLTDDKRKCAVGLFIKDGHPAQKEGASAVALLTEHPDVLDMLPSKNIEFWRDIQYEHDDLDRSLNVEEQKKQLINFVKENTTKDNNNSV